MISRSEFVISLIRIRDIAISFSDIINSFRDIMNITNSGLNSKTVFHTDMQIHCIGQPMVSQSDFLLVNRAYTVFLSP